ncbi:MAG: tetratricopeptide repeat protein [Alcaligenaceae bacterium]|nr:tetratricopeptide repeat protein [Alcaligenaceae bacterium]
MSTFKKQFFIILSMVLFCANQAFAVEINELKRQAEKGDKSAQYAMAVHYATGDAVVEDVEEAAKWFLMAANQGHADAQVNLAVWYAMGLGVEQNQQEAFKWYQRAAAQGDSQAQYSLASRYYKGFGVKRDSAHAQKLYASSCRGGFELSCKALRVLEFDET